MAYRTNQGNGQLNFYSKKGLTPFFIFSYFLRKPLIQQ